MLFSKHSNNACVHNTYIEAMVRFNMKYLATVLLSNEFYMIDLVNMGIFNIFSNKKYNKEAMAFATPEVSSVTHASTGAERFLSTCSPTELKALNEVFKVNILNEGKTTDEMMANTQRDCEQGHQHVFLWYTEEMYKANTVEGNSITQIGGTCFQPTLTHAIGNTTLHDAVCCAGYQLGQLHTITSNLNKLYIIMFKLDTVNIDVGSSRWNDICLQPAGCTTQVQFHKKYFLSNKEIATQAHFELAGDIANIFKVYSWATGFAWTYHVPIKFQDALNMMTNRACWIHFAMQQAIEYAGLSVVNKLPEQIQQMMIEYCLKLNITLATNTDLSEDHIRGRPDIPNKMVQRQLAAFTVKRQQEMEDQHMEESANMDSIN